MSCNPAIVSIVNITEDSFSDGGRYLEVEAALQHARELAACGADILDLGAAASNIDAKPVTAEEEIRRLAPVIEGLRGDGIPISVDSFSPVVQRWALGQGVAYLNDIQGFPEPAVYPDLAAADAKLIVMHSVQGRGKATVVDVPPTEILDRILGFFEVRIGALTGAGIARERLILDPGMGFFLGSNPETSLTVLRRLPELKREFGLPVLVGVSRKSFLRKHASRGQSGSGPVSLVAELFAAVQGADYIRTHVAGPLADGLAVWRAATRCNTA